EKPRKPSLTIGRRTVRRRCRTLCHKHRSFQRRKAHEGAPRAGELALENATGNPAARPAGTFENRASAAAIGELAQEHRPRHGASAPRLHKHGMTPPVSLRPFLAHPY